MRRALHREPAKRKQRAAQGLVDSARRQAATAITRRSAVRRIALKARQGFPTLW